MFFHTLLLIYNDKTPKQVRKKNMNLCRYIKLLKLKTLILVLPRPTQSNKITIFGSVFLCFGSSNNKYSDTKFLIIFFFFNMACCDWWMQKVMMGHVNYIWASHSQSQSLGLAHTHQRPITPVFIFSWS